MNKLITFFKQLVLIQNDTLIKMTEAVAEQGVALLAGEAVAQACGPTFNHNTTDSFYHPCQICAGQMSKEELLEVIKYMQAQI